MPSAPSTSCARRPTPTKIRNCVRSTWDAGRPRGSAVADHDDGLARDLDHALFLELLERAPDHLARAADDAADLLARNANLLALRMRHRIRFVDEVEQGLGDAAGDVHEGEPADLARGM